MTRIGILHNGPHKRGPSWSGIRVHSAGVGAYRQCVIVDYDSCYLSYAECRVAVGSIKKGTTGCFGHVRSTWLHRGRHVVCHVRGRACEAPVCRACEAPALTVLPSLRGRVFLASLRASRGLSCELASILRGGYCVNNITGSRGFQDKIGIYYFKLNIIMGSGGYQKQNPTENSHK